MRTLTLLGLTVGLATPAMAAATIPEEYQGAWAAAQDCKQNFQNVLSHVVNWEYATCRVMRVISSGRPGLHTDTIRLNCGGLQSRETWHDENIDGTDFLIAIQFERGAESAAEIAIYKRCPEIPLTDIPLSEIPGTDTRR